MGACAVLGISNQDALSEDLENDPFLNSALQRFTCELYYRFGSFLAPLSIGIITSRHYLSEHNKNGGTSGDNEDPTTTEQGGNDQNLLTSSKSEGPIGCATTGWAQASGIIGSFIGMGIVGFCARIGLMLAVKTVNNLEELIRR